jgi:hypothetical protein
MREAPNVPGARIIFPISSRRPGILPFRWMGIRYPGCCVAFIFNVARGRDCPDVGAIHRGFIAAG